MPRLVGLSRRRPLTPDIWIPAPRLAEVTADVMRVKARLAQRAASKPSADNVGKRPTVARLSTRLTTLQQSEGNPKGMYRPLDDSEHLFNITIAIRLTAPVQPAKPCTVQSVKPRNLLAGKLTGASSKHLRKHSCLPSSSDPC